MESKRGRSMQYKKGTTWYSLDGRTSRHIIEREEKEIEYEDQDKNIRKCGIMAFLSWASKHKVSINNDRINYVKAKAIIKIKKEVNIFIDTMSR